MLQALSCCRLGASGGCGQAICRAAESFTLTSQKRCWRPSQAVCETGE